jgi:glycerophosphoryl diester phosphodiesterase
MGLLMLFARPAAEHPYFGQDKNRPLVMAHRGGSGLWPENTMYGFERAVGLGVDVLETEVQSTADGVLALIHDSTVDRTTQGTGAINEITLRELQELDAGYNWSSDGGRTFPFRGQGITVPTLEEVFAAFPNMRINIDLKQTEPSLVLRLCEMIRTFGMTDKVMVASFNSKVIQTFRRECPEVTTSFSVREVTLFYLMNLVCMATAYRTAAYALQIPEYYGKLRVLTKKFIDAAHSLNLKVHVWTINETDDMRRLLNLGVDGIITDYPDRLITLLGRDPNRII